MANGMAKKPSSAGIWIGLVLMLLGIGGCVGGVVLGGVEVANAIEDIDKLAVPVTQEYDFEENASGFIVAFADTSADAKQVSVTLTGPDGTDLELSSSSSFTSTDTDSSGQAVEVVGAFDAKQAGKYVLSADGPRGIRGGHCERVDEFDRDQVRRRTRRWFAPHVDRLHRAGRVAHPPLQGQKGTCHGSRWFRRPADDAGHHAAGDGCTGRAAVPPAPRRRRTARLPVVRAADGPDPGFAAPTTSWCWYPASAAARAPALRAAARARPVRAAACRHSVPSPASASAVRTTAGAAVPASGQRSGLIRGAVPS